ncbi:MAG: type II secretion system F family protein [Propionibacteriaceae bacterium]|jgi:tight adherence protein C|nr:type II secretion system F family protein [Propionibacteriaceae bacterium]
MNALLFAAPAAACMAVFFLGWRLMRVATPDFGEIDQDSAPVKVKRSPTQDVADWIGVRCYRLMLRWYTPKRTRSLERLLDRAGRPERMGVRVYIRRQGGLVFIGAVLFAVLALVGSGLAGLAIFALFVGFLPLWLQSQARSRQAAISADLPDFLDVLAVTVQAGLSLQAALERVSENDERPLAQEVRRVLEDMRLGVGRRRAFSALRARNDNPMVGSWVTSMLQAEELGTPLTEALNSITEDMRGLAAQEAKRQAARAAPKVSMVVTLVLLPGALILIVSAFLINNLQVFASIFGGS